MIQQGKVISADGDIAVVEIIRESACSSCHKKDSCGAGVMAGCAKNEKVTVKANNICAASVGDTVELTSDSARTLGIAFCVFVVPLLLFFCAYFICGYFFASSAVKYAVSGIVFAAAFFGLFFGLDRMLSGRINVNITGIIETKADTEKI